MNLKYQRILRAVVASPWAIVPGRLQDICDVLAYQALGGKLSAAEVNEFLELHAAAKQPRATTGRGVAVIGLRGILANRIEQVQGISGPEGTSMEGFRSRFREALNASVVDAIVLDVDSPGGNVEGIQEMADEIAGARGSKPIVAVANTMAASAAYWLASQADEIVATPSASVGSIGVFAAHRDVSVALENEGEKVTLISAGKYKVEGNPFEPLGEDARIAVQARVDEVYDTFTEAVARGRNVKTTAVRNGFGEGRAVSAREALAEGMIDRIATMDDTINRLRGGDSRRSSRNARRISPAAFEFLSPARSSVPQ